MAENNQVWAVSTPGAPHDASLARKDVYASTGGVTGLIAEGGGGVGLTPGTPMSVRLEPCAVVAKSTYAGARRQSYSFDVESSVDVPIEVTGSGGGRTDVVALIVSDPILEDKKVAEVDANGELIDDSEGLDPRAYDYWNTHVFTSVPSSARRTPEDFRQWAIKQNVVPGPVIPYAIVTQGADSTGLEGKVQPFFDSVMGRKDNIIVDQEITKTFTEEGSFSAYRTLGPSVLFDVPWWATRARVKAKVQGVSLYSSSRGNRSGKVSGLVFGQSMRQYRYYESGESAWARQSFDVWADLAIPAARRGTTQDFRFRVTVSQSHAQIRVSEWSHVFLDIEFLEDPNAVDNSDPGTD